MIIYDTHTHTHTHTHIYIHTHTHSGVAKCIVAKSMLFIVVNNENHMLDFC